MADTFPRQQARTQRFALGAPRTFSVAPDGSRVLFLRSSSGTDPSMSLWELDVATGAERVVADPASEGDGPGVTAEERAQRERRRERAAGITSYSPDRSLRRAVFALRGDLWAVDVVAGEAHEVAVPGPVFDPRLDPGGTRVSWCRGRELWVAGLDGSDPRRLVGEEDPDVSWGQAEFVAAEEMDRDRGHWWLADGGALLVARVDVGPVPTWWVSDPAHPGRAPMSQRYPAAGTTDADVSLWIVGLDGGLREAVWDRATFSYLVSVAVPSAGGPVLAVERRDHHAGVVLALDPATGTTSVVVERTDDAWLEWVPGLPTRLADGRAVWSEEVGDTTSLVVDGTVATPAGLEVRAVVAAGADVVFTAWEEPTRIGLWRWSPSGTVRLEGGGVVTAAAAGGGTVVASHRTADRAGVTCRTLDERGTPIGTIRSHTEPPLVTAHVRFLEVGPDRLATGVVLPTGHRAGSPLPVLMLPYGGPGAQKVLADQHAWLEAQWCADRGFAVVVVDGRGTPGRGPAWTRRVHLDLACVLEDQITGLRGAAEAVPELDLARVGISGWSFGGYLAALAVLRRPDIFHAAVAGAPVTDWTLYDTYYTEKYLGHPDADPSVYPRSSLLDDAALLSRPLLLVHGLVDDNVFVAHTLRFSQRLVAAGRAHAVLPLTGVTHMASQEEVAENLLLLQMGFLADALGVPA